MNIVAKMKKCQIKNSGWGILTWTLPTLNSITFWRKFYSFTAFIDLRKCFDCIDIYMILYKLLEHNIDGDMYSSIKMIYQPSSSYVRVKDKTTE